MLSYAGENRRVPARFKVYNIDSSYTIMRPKGVKFMEKKVEKKEDKRGSKRVGKKSVAVKDGYIPIKDYAVKKED